MRTVVSYGAGTNSTALLIGLHNRNERPDAIVFADTGGERPETYAHIEVMNDWCKKVLFPEIITVRKGGRPETLEENCLRMNMLPSIAYGYKSCSHKYKIEPQEKWANNDDECRAEWKGGGKVTKLIGIDADEHHRAKFTEDKKYLYRYPLVEWDWGRDECVAAIVKAGIDLPGKSACFFCPSSKTREILALPKYLQDRALALEANAELTTIKGLGRNYAWSDLIRADKAQGKFDFETRGDIPCGCYDGEGEIGGNL